MANPIKKVKKYVQNVDKELTDIYGNQGRLGSGQNVQIAKGDANIVKLPNGKTVKIGLSEKEANKILRNDRGQLFGALLQGRRYDAGVKTTTPTVNKVYRPSSNK